MKNLKRKIHFRINLKSKHLLAVMTLFCVSCIVATFASGAATAPLQEAAGLVVVPFEKSINRIGQLLTLRKVVQAAADTICGIGIVTVVD